MKRWEQLKRRPRRRAPSGDRSAFTLIELLVTISIIATLGAISITTARSAIETARRSQTETTIAKVDSVITAIYERYQYLRVEPENANASPALRAWSRVARIRDLLRCDMPCVPAELKCGWAGAGYVFTPLQESYRAAINGAYRDAANPFDAWLRDGDLRIRNAELLYLVATNGDPESRSSFSDREVADTDGNGLLEFVDGWGRPICWMRWAPGLESSDRQPPIPADDGEGNGRFVYDDELRDADPFNPLGVSGNAISEGGALPTVNYPDKGWFLAPYVFSGGSDVDSDENTDDVWYGLIAPHDYSNDPYTPAFGNPAIADGAPDGSKTHKDNIDNHTLAR